MRAGGVCVLMWGCALQFCGRDIIKRFGTYDLHTRTNIEMGIKDKIVCPEAHNCVFN